MQVRGSFLTASSSTLLIYLTIGVGLYSLTVSTVSLLGHQLFRRLFVHLADVLINRFGKFVGSGFGQALNGARCSLRSSTSSASVVQVKNKPKSSSAVILVGSETAMKGVALGIDRQRVVIFN